jgi:hypothetical protein
LQELHGEVLRFKARHWTKSISDSNANKEVYSMWQEALQLKDISHSVETGVSEMAAYFRDIATEEEQVSAHELKRSGWFGWFD